MKHLVLEFPHTQAREPALIGGSSPQLLVYSEHGLLRADLQEQIWQFQEQPLAENHHPFMSGILDLQESRPSQSESSFVGLRNGVAVHDKDFVGWSPDFVHDAKGMRHLVYDHAKSGDFDIYYQAGNGAPQRITSSPRFEAHPSIAVDSQDRIWLAWDEGKEAWGQTTGLHLQRRMVLVVQEDGAWKEVPLPKDELLLAPGHNDDLAPIASNAELPRLAVDRHGVVWLFFRVMRVYPHSSSRRAARVVAWEIRATSLSENGWSEVVSMPLSDGPNHDTLALIPHPQDGVIAAWTTDRRRERFELQLEWHKRLMRNARVVSAHLQNAAAAPPSGASANWNSFQVEQEKAGSIPPAWMFDPEPALVASDYQRLWGDLHRHSDISRCKIEEDGSGLDQFRYAHSVANLDFLALTDHVQHMSGSAWALEMAMSERFGSLSGFSTLFGFERAMPGGHRNFFTTDPELAADGPFFKGNEQQALEHFAQEHFLAIPHQLSDNSAVLHWREHFEQLETLVEIFQGRRGSYEAVGAPRLDLRSKAKAPHATDYLEQGRRFGFIASSDHVSSGHAFAAILAKDNTPAAIFEAMQARRAYAATAKIALDVQLGDLQMGEADKVNPDAPLHIGINAGAPIARVDVIRSGEIVQSWNGGNETDAEWESALLSIRLRRESGSADMELFGNDIRLGAPLSFDVEADDLCNLVETENGTALQFSAQVIDGDTDGWMIPIQIRRSAGAAKLQTLNPQDSLDWLIDDLRAGPKRRRLDGAQVSMEMHPAPLGTSTFTTDWSPQDWRSGDWVYVRIMRTDGAMAWSSPIWVD